MTKTIHIALTGHRPPKLDGYNINTPKYQALMHDLKEYIRFQLKTHDIVWCHSGLALGADTIWSKAILEMKAEYPNRVFFHAEIPFWEQPNSWFKSSDINFWQEQVDSADARSVYDPDFGQFKKLEPNDYAQKRRASKALQDRNIGMIDHADVLLAVYDGKSNGGTRNAINYATDQNKTIQFIETQRYFGK